MIIPDVPMPKKIRMLTTTRQTDLQDIDNILPFPLAQQLQIKQVHGINIIQAYKDNACYSGLPEADAVFATQPEVACIVRTADCLPILISDSQSQCVCAIHAGWRGLVKGIIQHSLTVLPVHPSHLFVWLGPAIGPHAFEVGEEVYQQFLCLLPVTAKAFISYQQRYLCDIYQLAKIFLVQSGVNINRIFGGQYCTVTDTKRFYSYRSTHGKETGRLLSIIWINA